MDIKKRKQTITKSKIYLWTTFIILTLSSCASTNGGVSNYSVNNESRAGVINLDTNGDMHGDASINEAQEKALTEENYIVPLPEKAIDFTSDGIIYYNANPIEYQKCVPVNISFDELQINNGNVEGYKEEVIAIHYCTKGIYSAECVDYSNVILPMTELCDIETGVIYTADVVEEKLGIKDGYAYSGSLNIGDSVIQIEYRCDVSYTESDWNRVDDISDEYSKDINFDVVFTVTVPETYENLGLKISPTTSYEEYQRMSENEDYDNVEEYSPKGTKLIVF